MGNKTPGGCCGNKDNQFLTTLKFNTFAYKSQYRNVLIAVVQQDIFSIRADAIVNPTLGI